ncbi:MAG: hypothetical protein RRB13_09965 [bacterium]|nr:hypothetical protein [bacterium]
MFFARLTTGLVVAGLLFFGGSRQALAVGKEAHSTVIALMLVSGSTSLYDGVQFNKLADENKGLETEYSTTTSTTRRLEIEQKYSKNKEEMQLLDKRMVLADQVTLAFAGLEVVLLLQTGLEKLFSDGRHWELRPMVRREGSGFEFSWKY